MKFKWQLPWGSPLIFALAMLTHIAFAVDEVPLCAPPTNRVPPTVIQYSGDLPVSADDSSVYRPLRAQQIAIDANFTASGRLSCASPLSGFSLYWPYAVEALKKMPHSAGANQSEVIVLFHDPVADKLRTGPKALVPRCSEAQSVATTLQNALVLMNRGSKQIENARECLKLALAADPDSLAANYGLAIAESLAKDRDAAITFLEKVTLLREYFYEALLEKARLYGEIGNKDKEDGELNDILAERPPLPVRREILRRLIRLYDDLNRRADALAAEQSLIATEKQLQNIYPVLVPDSLIAMNEASVGLRFEEQKDYRQAEDAYRLAARNGSQFGQSFLFEQAMGLSRSLRQLGKPSSAQLICSEWKALLQQLGPALNELQWHGKELAFAKWQLSCGDAAAGLEQLRSIAVNDAGTPNVDPYRAAAPYHALETFYRSEGDPDQARAAHIGVERIQSDPSQHSLRAVLRDCEPLFHPPKQKREKGS